MTIELSLVILSDLMNCRDNHLSPKHLVSNDYAARSMDGPLVSLSCHA